MVAFSLSWLQIFLKMFASVSSVRLTSEKTERMFNSKEYNNMKTKIDIAEILKDKPQGTKLYDLLRNIDVVLDKVHITDVGNYIECISTNEVGSTLKFDYSKLGTEGCWLDGLQILLPSKGMRDWRKFAWKKGDVLVSNSGKVKVIFDKFRSNTYLSFIGKNGSLS